MCSRRLFLAVFATVLLLTVPAFAQDETAPPEGVTPQDEPAREPTPE